jgi:hypothetical protein
MRHKELLIHNRKIQTASASREFRSSRSFLYCLFLAGAVFSLGGCSGRQSGIFHFEVLTPQENDLRQEFAQSCYACNDDGQVTVVLRARQRIQSKIKTRNVVQLLIIKTFWRPQRGLTPFTASATNANIEYLIEVDSQTAWYRGAGFVQVKPNQFPRDQQIHLRSATLELYQHTTGFPVTFIKANVIGQAHAIYDPEFVNELLVEYGEKCGIIKDK